MASKIDIDIHGIIMFNLRLGDKMYELFGKIMVKKYDQYVTLPYTYGVMYLGISEADREKLILYLHNEQLKSLQ